MIASILFSIKYSLLVELISISIQQGDSASVNVWWKLYPLSRHSMKCMFYLWIFLFTLYSFTNTLYKYTNSTCYHHYTSEMSSSSGFVHYSFGFTSILQDLSVSEPCPSFQLNQQEDYVSAWEVLIPKLLDRQRFKEMFF